jgi:hypothetical protein
MRPALRLVRMAATFWASSSPRSGFPARLSDSCRRAGDLGVGGLFALNYNHARSAMRPCTSTRPATASRWLQYELHEVREAVHRGERRSSPTLSTSVSWRHQSYSEELRLSSKTASCAGFRGCTCCIDALARRPARPAGRCLPRSSAAAVGVDLPFRTRGQLLFPLWTA